MKIEFLFENCEVYTVDEKDCKNIRINHIFEVYHKGNNTDTLQKYKYMKSLRLELLPSANINAEKAYTFSEMFLFERIQKYNDIVKLIIKDGNEEDGIYVYWQGDNSETNLAQKSTLQSNGNLLITIKRRENKRKKALNYEQEVESTR